MKKQIFIPLVSLLLLLVACNSTSPIVGKWKGEITQNGQTLKVDAEFTADGKFTQSVDIPMTDAKAVSKGTYTLEGDQISATHESVELVGELPAELQAMKAQFEKSMKSEIGKTNTGTVTFEGDKFTQTSNGVTVTFTKVK